MAFFTYKKGDVELPKENAPISKKLKEDIKQNVITYAPADYYIAEMSKEANKFTIKQPSIPNSHDTSTKNGQGFSGTGPDDYDDYYNSNKFIASQLFITHEPTQYAVQFPAILESYSETFKPSYSQEQVYGRMDPIYKYTSTSRTISVTFKVIAYDEDHAHRNLHALSSLAEFLYPVYDYGTLQLDGRALPYQDALSNATAIRESPLLRVRFANLIQRTDKAFKNSSNANYANAGLLVAPTSFNFEPDKEAGYFPVEDNYLFPKQIKLSLNFNVLHENTLGWKATNDDMTDFRWIGNLSNQNSEKQNNNSVIFPWGDITFKQKEQIIKTAQEAEEQRKEAEQMAQQAPTGSR